MTHTKKFPSWLATLILTGLGLSVGPHQILTRTDEVSRVLSPVLSRYEVIRMAPGAIEQQVRTTGELRLRFQETDFYFNLEPHDMRAPNYRAVETGPGGVRRTLPPQPVHTFKGVMAGREDTRGRFNLTDGGVEGVVYAPEGWIYVEPLGNYLPSAPAGALVVYRHADIKPGEAFKCGVSLPHRLHRGVGRVTVQAEAANSTTPTNYVFDVATEADYEYVQALGGPVEANREIEGILNIVEGVYQNELLLQLRISFQNTWATEDDPYNATNSLDLMDEFAEYWNTHYAGTVDYDLAHLWTDRERDDWFVGGRASLGVMCELRSHSYGFSTRKTNLPDKYLTPTHEIGHNFGATHPDEQVPPVTTCKNTVMVGGSISGGWNPQLTFCQFSREQIAAHVAGNNSCLDAQEIVLQPPTDLSASVVSNSRINLAWRDNSTNETGFIVQRRREGSGTWLQSGSAAADAETLSIDGLFSEATYIFRMRAFNDEVSSAFSNEAAATTLSGEEPPGTAWIIDTVAGRTDNDGDNGPAIRARLAFPVAVAVDRSGNLYIADSGNHRIRRVDPEGTITTVAGIGGTGINNLGGYSGDGGPAVEGQLYYPSGVAVDGAGNLYISDTWNHRIRRVDPERIITTVASGYDYVDGFTVDDVGNLYIVDADNRRVQRVDVQGAVTTVAGTGEWGFSGDGGPANEAQLTNPSHVVLDSAGNLYISGSQQIRRVDGRGIITTVAGVFRGIGNNSVGGYSGDGGPAVEAELYLTRGLAVDISDNLYIADSANHRIRRVDEAGIITTVAGSGKGNYSGDGELAVKAELYDPEGVTVDSTGNLYIADTRNNRIRRVDTSGIITTVAGTGIRGFSGDGGPANEAQLNWPRGVAVDRTGNLYIADTWNSRIRRVDPAGTITTVAGGGRPGYGDYRGEGGGGDQGSACLPGRLGNGRRRQSLHCG